HGTLKSGKDPMEDRYTGGMKTYRKLASAEPRRLHETLLRLRFWRDEGNSNRFYRWLRLHDLADQLSGLDRRDHARHIFIAVDPGEHHHAPRRREELEDPDQFPSGADQDDQLLILLQRVLHGLDLPQDRRAH